MKRNAPIPIALFGMDDRAVKTLIMYLQGPCQGVAVVVDEFDAAVDVIDADHMRARDILQERQTKAPNRPIILLSLQPLSIAGTLHVNKPVQADELINALKQSVTPVKKKAMRPEPVEAIELNTDTAIETANPVAYEIAQPVRHPVDSAEKRKVKKHRTAEDLTESGSLAYIGYIEGIDFTDRSQALNASFSPRSYFLGYIHSAIKVARDKGCAVRLNSSWKPLVILPHSHEIWLDADDKQLRAFCGIEFKNANERRMSLTPIEPNAEQIQEEKVLDMDAFLWKVAIWTSKGRYSDTLDINHPVYLKHWPNFTRLVIPPHGLRIAALLLQGPRTLMNIADTLNVQPQYVFVFITAAHTLGLIGQAKRNADQMVVPQKPEHKGQTGLLSRILNKLKPHSK